jgi:hypothetical protein
VILGRPTNLWTGALTSIVGVVTIILISAGFDPTLVAQLSGAIATALGAIILLVANGTPTVAAGSTVNVQTPSGQPNASATLDIAPSGEVTATS